MSADEKIVKLAEEFERCRKVLLAPGDENRRHMILAMMGMGHCGGVRVGELTKKQTCRALPCRTT